MFKLFETRWRFIVLKEARASFQNGELVDSASTKFSYGDYYYF
jgi:hypothetical protein